MPEWGAGAWSCPWAQQLSHLPTTRRRGLTGHLAPPGGWPQTSGGSSPEAAGVAEGEPGQLQHSQHPGTVPGSCRGVVCREKHPPPLQGTAGALLLSHWGVAGLAPVLFSPAWRGTPPEAHPPWLQRDPGRTVAPIRLLTPPSFISSQGAMSSASSLALQVLSQAPDSAGAERGLGKHLMYLFSHLALSLTNSCWLFLVEKMSQMTFHAYFWKYLLR